MFQAVKGGGWWLMEPAGWDLSTAELGAGAGARAGAAVQLATPLAQMSTDEETR